MCFSPKAPHDNSAQIASDNEAQRESKIKQGQSSIDSAFTQFDDPYYAGISKNYEDYYDPQLDTQYNDALNKLTLNLGQQGILQSSEGNRQLAELKRTQDTQKQTIANNAIAAGNTAKQQVAQQKNQLYAQNNTAADPSAAATAAATAAGSVVSPPVYSPLGNAFAGLLGQGTNALALQAGGTPGVGGSFFGNNANTAGIGASPSSSPAGKVVQ